MTLPIVVGTGFLLFALVICIGIVRQIAAERRSRPSSDFPKPAGHRDSSNEERPTDGGSPA
jgi:hypothetical protein